MRRQNSLLFFIFTLAVIVLLVSLTVVIGHQAAFFKSIEGVNALIPYSILLGGCFSLFAVVRWVFCKISDLSAECRSLHNSYNEVSLTYQRARDDLNNLYNAAIQSLAATMEARDADVLGHHLKHVADYSLALAVELGLSPEELTDIYYASILHDLGKIGISESILNKPSRLSEDELTKIRQHPEIGARIVNTLVTTENILSLILHHHEFYDGTGYPTGLAKQQIPLGARIIAIADAYDAMTSNRPYRRAFPHNRAVVELIQNAGTQFDPYLVMRFLEIIGREKPKLPDIKKPSPVSSSIIRPGFTNIDEKLLFVRID